MTRARCGHVELPPLMGARRHLLLHREPAGAPSPLVGRSWRPAARRVPHGEGGTTVRGAGHRGVAGPSALRVAAAGRRRRQRQPLGADQIHLQPSAADQRAPLAAAHGPVVSVASGNAATGST